MPPEIDPVLAQVLSPVNAKIAELEGEIRKLEEQLEAKRIELRPYRRVLSAATRNGAKPGPKPKSNMRADGSYAISAKSIERVEAYIREHFSSREIIATHVWREWKESGQENWPSAQTILEALKALHRAGVVRLARRGSGGSMVFRLVA